MSCSRARFGERGDHVVGLVAVHLDVGEAEGLGQRHQVGPLVAQQVGPRLALGLVGLVGELAARPARVPADDHGRRVVVDQHLGEHRGEPVDRVGRPPVVGRDRLRQREERPVGERVAVDQEELGRLLLGPSRRPSSREPSSGSLRAPIHHRLGPETSAEQGAEPRRGRADREGEGASRAQARHRVARSARRRPVAVMSARSASTTSARSRQRKSTSYGPTGRSPLAGEGGGGGRGLGRAQLAAGEVGSRGRRISRRSSASTTGATTPAGEGAVRIAGACVPACVAAMPLRRVVTPAMRECGVGGS